MHWRCVWMRMRSMPFISHGHTQPLLVMHTKTFPLYHLLVVYATSVARFSSAAYKVYCSVKFVAQAACARCIYLCFWHVNIVYIMLGSSSLCDTIVLCDSITTLNIEFGIRVDECVRPTTRNNDDDDDVSWSMHSVHEVRNILYFFNSIDSVFCAKTMPHGHRLVNVIYLTDVWPSSILPGASALPHSPQLDLKLK